MKLALLFIALSLSASACFAMDNEAGLASLETQFFHHDFAGQDLNVRVARLEKSVFGEASEGPIADRVTRLLNLEAAAQGSISTPSKAEPSVADASVADEDCAIQRAQVAIKAAGEAQSTELLAEAVKLFRDGKLHESRERFEQVIQIDPNNADANFSLGIIDEGSGNLAEALSSYRKALAAKPDKTEYRDAVAALKEKMSKYAGLDSRRVQIRSLSSAAMQAYMKGQYQTALNLYLALDEKSPNQAIVKSNLATVYIALKQPEKAAEYYRQAAKINPYDDRFKQGLSHAENLLQTDNNNANASLEQKLDAFEQPQGDGSFQNLGLRGGSVLR
jgi:tetratricopeptide (TPR) repeat protein